MQSIKATQLYLAQLWLLQRGRRLRGCRAGFGMFIPFQGSAQCRVDKEISFYCLFAGPVHRAAPAWPLGLLCAVSILHGSVCREIKTELLDLYCGVHFRVLHEFNWHEHN